MSGYDCLPNQVLCLVLCSLAEDITELHKRCVSFPSSVLLGLTTFRISYLKHRELPLPPRGGFGKGIKLPHCLEPELPGVDSFARNGQMHCDVLVPNINCDHRLKIEGWRKRD